MLIGAHFGGRNGMILAFPRRRRDEFLQLLLFRQMALSMYRAQPVTREQLPRVYQIVERILRAWRCHARIYVIPTDSPTLSPLGAIPNMPPRSRSQQQSPLRHRAVGSGSVRR